MSQFAAQPLQPSPGLRPTWDDDQQPIRAAAVDSLVKQNRAVTPAVAQSQRAVQRLSISELNDLDVDQIRERFAKTKLDNRGPVVRFLDLVDLPRNTIAGILAPSIKARKEAEGETGTFGQGKVYSSDILNELGVKNHVARAIGGFVGDILLDPLTYTGPAGWGAKGVSAAGKTGQLGSKFLKVAEEAQSAFAAGREAADPLLREYIKHAAPKTADELGTLLHGSAQTKTSRVLGVIGDDKDFKGSSGLLTDALDDVIHPLTAPKDADRIRAAKAVYERYGRHNAPGVRVGRDEAGKLGVEASMSPGRIKAGTGYFHLPFTDIGIYGPAVTNRARMGVAAGLAARGVETSGAIDPDLQKMGELSKVINGMHEEAETLKGRLGELDAMPANPLDIAVPTERALHVSRMREIADTLRGPYDPVTDATSGGLIQQMNDHLRAFEKKGADSLTNPADILHAQKLFTATDANARRLAADATIQAERPAILHAKREAYHGEFDKEVGRRVEADKKAHAASVAEEAANSTRLTAYHGSEHPAPSLNPEHSNRKGVRAVWFSTDPETAQGFAGTKGTVLQRDIETSNLFDYRNPAHLDQLKAAGVDDVALSNIARGDWYAMESPEVHRALVDMGFQGHIAREGSNPGLAIAAYDKSVIRPAGEVVPSKIAPFNENTSRLSHAAGFRDEYLARLRPNDQAIFNMSPETMEAHSRFADAYHAKMAANVDLATALSGPLTQTLSSKDRALADAAKMAIGLSPDDLGHTLFAPLRSVSKSLADDREGSVAFWARQAEQGLAGADAKLRQMFGRHSGKTHEALRDYLRASSPASNPAAVDTMAELGKAVKELVSDPAHNITPAQRPDFERLAGNLVDHLAFEANAGTAGDPIFAHIKDAVDNGLLSEAAHPGLYAKTRELAQQWTQRLKELGQLEVEQGRLTGLRDTYGLPSLLTKETAERIRNQNKFSAAFSSPRGGDVAGQVVESFQKPRSTDTYRFVTKGKDGAEIPHEFMEGERVFMNYDAKALARMDPDTAAGIEKIQEAIKAHDALPPSLRPVPIPASRFKVNQMVKDGRFQWLTGGPLQGDFFETAIGHAIANRYGSSAKSYLHGRLMEFATQHGRPMREEKIAKVWQSSPNGSTFQFDNGAFGRLQKGSDGRPFLWIGDQRFRQIDPNIGLNNAQDPVGALMGSSKKLHSLWFPDEIADLMEKANLPFRSESTIQGIIKGADELNKLWKTVTLFHPSWTIGDLVGGLILAGHAGVTPGDMVKHGKDALRIVMAHHRKDLEGLSKIELQSAGRALTGLDVARGPQASAIFGGGQAMEAAMQMLGNGQIVPTSTYSLFKNPGKAIGEEWNRADAIARAHLMGKTWGDARAAQKLAQTRAFVNDGVLRKVVAPWFQLNGLVNDWVRTSTYLSLLDKGNDAQSAAREVSRHLFDMSTLSATEENLRRLVPFYSWAKASGVYGVRQLMEDPKFFQIAPNLKRTLEEAVNGEENLPEYARPSWMRDQQALMFGSGDTRKAVLFQSMLPTEAATYFANGLGSPVLGANALQDAIAYFGNSLSPVIKAPLEIGSHREWFTKREIGGDTGDLTVPEYLLNQIRPIKELGIGGIRQGPLQSAFARSPGEGVARALIGGRLQPATDDRLNFNLTREQADLEKSIRSRINIAEREGAKDESLRLRVQLLHLYADSQKKGVKTPAWAKKQLAQLPGSQPTT